MMAQVPKFRFSSLIIFHNLFLHMYRCRWSVYTWKHFFSKVIINMLRWLKGRKMVGIPFVIEKIFLFKVALFFGGFYGYFSIVSHPVWMDIGNINMSQGPIYLIKNIKSTCPMWHDWAISEKCCKSLSKEVPNSTAVLSCFLAFVDS